MYVILQLQHSVGDVSNSTSSTVQSLTELVVFFCCLCDHSVCVELLVLNAIFMLVFLERLVMKLVSLPMYAKVAHLGVGYLCACIRCLFFVGVGWWTWRWRVDWEAVFV